MGHDWTDLIGKTIGDGHVLAEFRSSSGDLGRFLTSSGAIVEVVPADSPAAAGPAETWPATARLRHPNLIGVLDSGTDDLDGVAVLYRVTERPEESVAEVLPDRPLAEDEARQVLEGVVPALAHLHENGFVHGALHADNIVAVGNSVKLTIEPVHAGGAQAVQADIVDLGRTVVEMLTQKRPDAGADYTTRLPAPFGPIAGGTIAQGWTLDMVARTLAGQPVSFTGAESRRPAPPAAPEAEGPSALAQTLRSRPLMMAAGALLLVLLAFAFMRPSKQRAASAPAPVPVPEARQERPNPVSARNPSLPAATPRPEATRTRRGDYAVIAATYKSQAAAEQRARSLQKRWNRSEISVEAQGSYYVVVLANGVTRDEAERLQKQARSSGLPRDTHVTRIR